VITEPSPPVSVASVIAQLQGPWQPRDLAFANDKTSSAHCLMIEPPEKFRQDS
jgi:hypothetical protein